MMVRSIFAWYMRSSNECAAYRGQWTVPQVIVIWESIVVHLTHENYLLIGQNDHFTTHKQIKKGVRKKSHMWKFLMHHFQSSITIGYTKEHFIILTPIIDYLRRLVVLRVWVSTSWKSEGEPEGWEEKKLMTIFKYCYENPITARIVWIQCDQTKRW